MQLQLDGGEGRPSGRRSVAGQLDDGLRRRAAGVDAQHEQLDGVRHRLLDRPLSASRRGPAAAASSRPARRRRRRRRPAVRPRRRQPRRRRRPRRGGAAGRRPDGRRWSRAEPQRSHRRPVGGGGQEEHRRHDEHAGHDGDGPGRPPTPVAAHGGLPSTRRRIHHQPARLSRAPTPTQATPERTDERVAHRRLGRGEQGQHGERDDRQHPRREPGLGAGRSPLGPLGGPAAQRRRHALQRRTPPGRRARAHDVSTAAARPVGVDGSAGQLVERVGQGPPAPDRLAHGRQDGPGRRARRSR